MGLLGLSLSAWVAKYGYAGLFFLLVVGILGLPVPDETLLTFSGFLAREGTFYLPWTYLTGFLGSVGGISLSYLIGRTLGVKAVTRYGARFGATPERIERVQAWFDRIGKWTLTFGYYVPGVRHFTAIVAGSSKLRFGLFALYAYLGAAIWSASFITAGYLVGDAWKRTSAEMHRYFAVAGAIVVVLIVAYVLWIRWRKKKKEKSAQKRSDTTRR